MNKMTSPLSSAPLALRHAVPARKSGPRIAADGLCKSYDTPSGPKHVLKDVSFAVGRGEKMAVLGRNGACHRDRGAGGRSVHPRAL